MATFPIKMVAKVVGKENMKNSKVNYDKIHRDMMDLILSGDLHSTLVGKLISVDHSDDDGAIKQAEEFTEYIVGLLKRSEERAKDVKAKG